MNKDSIVEEVKCIIEEISDIPQEEMDNDSSMIDDLDLSSLEVMSIISDIERKYSIKIAESEMLSISTIEELVDIILNKLG
jgi:acyl carrier protein